MKITKNFVDGQIYFNDVRQGQIFTTDDHMVYMKIQEVVPEDGCIVNAIYMEDGDTTCFEWDTKVTPVKNAELIIEVEN